MRDGNIIGNFEFYIDNGYYYIILQAQLSQANQSKEYVDLFKRYSQTIMDKSESKFYDIFNLMIIQDQLEVTEQFKDKELQKKLFNEIFSKNEDFQTDDIETSFRLLCKFKPNEVVSFLQKKTYQLERIKSLLVDCDHLRGLGYIYLKSGEEQLGLQYYQRHIIKQLELKDTQEIWDSVQDILNMDKALQEYDYILMVLIKFINELKLKPPFQKELIKSCFQKLFQKNSFEVLTLIIRYKFYDTFTSRLQTVQTLLFFYSMQDHLQRAKQNIFDVIDVNTKKHLRSIQMKGLQLFRGFCYICHKLDSPNKAFGKVYFHRCNTMFHQECLLSFPEHEYCVFCEKKNLYTQKEE